MLEKGTCRLMWHGTETGYGWASEALPAETGRNGYARPESLAPSSGPGLDRTSEAGRDSPVDLSSMAVRNPAANAFRQAVSAASPVPRSLSAAAVCRRPLHSGHASRGS
jgi:hypothetical protein